MVVGGIEPRRQDQVILIFLDQPANSDLMHDAIRFNFAGRHPAVVATAMIIDLEVDQRGSLHKCNRYTYAKEKSSAGARILNPIRLDLMGYLCVGHTGAQPIGAGT